MKIKIELLENIFKGMKGRCGNQEDIINVIQSKIE